jgi:hypothetical protein
MRAKSIIKHKREKKTDRGKRPLKYDATFDDILDLIVGADKTTNKRSYRLPGFR